MCRGRRPTRHRSTPARAAEKRLVDFSRLSISWDRDASYCRAALLRGSHSTPRGEMAMSARAVVYWVTTAFVVFNILSGGLAELAQLQGNAEGMRALGYPLYVMTILGMWKVLGSIALLA